MGIKEGPCNDHGGSKSSCDVGRVLSPLCLPSMDLMLPELTYFQKLENLIFY